MSDVDVIRAWKSPAYRRRLTQAQRSQLPAHPAGVINLSEAGLDNESFATTLHFCTTMISDPCSNCVDCTANCTASGC